MTKLSATVVVPIVVELGASNIFGRRGTCRNRDGLDDPARRRGSGRSRSWRPCGSRELMAYSSSKGRNGSETLCADGRVRGSRSSLAAEGGSSSDEARGAALLERSGDGAAGVGGGRRRLGGRERGRARRAMAAGTGTRGGWGSRGGMREDRERAQERAMGSSDAALEGGRGER